MLSQSEIRVGARVMVTGDACPSRGQKGAVIGFNWRGAEYGEICRVRLDSGRVLQGICSHYLTVVVEEEEASVKFNREFKIRVANPLHSKRVQKVLFALGYKWYSAGSNVSWTDKTFLYTDKKGHLTHSSSEEFFEGALAEEVDMSWLLPVETILIEGKTYYKQEVLEVLEAHCTVVN